MIFTKKGCTQPQDKYYGQLVSTNLSESL